ncbi:MAG: hypothetical protein ACP5JU_01215 [Minisyncoccia bacterium]
MLKFLIMLGGAHLIISNALIDKLTSNPLSGFALGVISHHICDYFPHLDLNSLNLYKNYKFKNLPRKIKLLILGEFLFGAFFSYFFFYKLYKIDFLIFFSVSIGAIFPDIITILFENYLKPPDFIIKYIYFHKKFHSENKNKIKGLVSEILIILLSILFFINAKNF